MQRDDVVLYADGGDMTVGRRTAVYTYGNFQVIIPDDREQETGDDRLQNGYISRPTERPTGRFDIGFVRADATIDLNAGTSDLESVIDAAQKRTEGDIFFERDISGRGLGRYQIGVDFDTDDVVQVEVWGKRLPLPVTSAEFAVTDSDGVRGQRVHVGGQLVADAEALRKHNDEILQQIASEKRQRLKEVGAVRRTADSAKDTADEALDAVQDADGEFRTRLEEVRGLVKEGRENASKIEGHLEEAGRLTGDADRYAREAVAAADAADLILATIEGDAEDVRAALIQIGGLHEQVRQNLALSQKAVVEGQAHVVEADRLAGIAQDHADLTVAYAEDSGAFVEEARGINEHISGLQQTINRLHGEAIQAAADAAAEAGVAAGHAGDSASEAGQAAQSAQDAAATNTEAIGILTEAQGLLQTAVSTNTDTIGKLRDAQALTNAGVRAAAAAAGQAQAATMQNSMAIQEVAKAAEYALEASDVLADTIEEREKVQQIVDRQQDESLILHENQLKWARWTNPIMYFRFTEESGEQTSRGNSIDTGMVDLRMNQVNGMGCEFITRPGWAGQVELKLTHIGGGEATIYGSLGNNTTAVSQILHANNEIRMASLKIWPQWSTEPREYVLRVDNQDRFGYMEGYQNQLEGEPVSHLGNGQIRFPHVSVVASEDVQILYGTSWVPVTSGEVIPLGAYIRPAPDDDEREGSLVVFTEQKPAMQWEPGAPLSGSQSMSVAAQTLGQSSWRTVATWTCPDWSSSVNSSLLFDTTFLESNPIASEQYIIRIMRNGGEVVRLRRYSHLGMNRRFQLERDLILYAGDRLDFQMYCSAGRSAERRVGGGIATINWG